MNKIFRHWLRTFNSFSKGDRNTIIILGSLILITIVATLILNNLQPKTKYNFADYERFLMELEAIENNSLASNKTLFHFNPNTISTQSLDTLDLPRNVKNNLLNYRKAGGKFIATTDLKKIYGMNDSIFEAIKGFVVMEVNRPKEKEISAKTKRVEGHFDPNQVEPERLADFGFSKFQSENLIRYRNKGGVFHKNEDLLKIYGVDSQFYNKIKSHIKIIVVKNPEVKHAKTKRIEIVELNKAGISDLEKLSGVGPVFAERITKYRKLLGGYYTKKQLLEVYNFPEETYKNIEQVISVDTLQVDKIRINFAEYTDLLSHPYLNKQQVEAVLDFRNKNGAFKNIRQLELHGLIESEIFVKIRPYLTCR